jgi:hypothetical protein
MKKIISYMLIIVIVAMLSCKDDHLSGHPSNASTERNTSPGVMVVQVGGDLSAQVFDGAGSPVKSVQFDVVDSTGATKISRTYTENLVAGENNFVWTNEESKLDELPSGSYKFNITAIDTDNNVGMVSSDLKILALQPACKIDGQVTVVLLSPEPPKSTDIVGFVGSPTGWGGSSGTDIVMHKITTGVYCCSLPMTAGAEFKFRLNENWGTQEGQSDGKCSDGSNRVYAGNGSDLIVQTVALWKPCN